MLIANAKRRTGPFGTAKAWEELYDRSFIRLSLGELS